MTVDEIHILVKAEVDKAISSFKKLNKETDNVSKGSQTLMDKFKNLQSVMQGPVAAAKQVVASFQQVYSALDNVMQAAFESELAFSRLGTALRATGADTSLEKLSTIARDIAGTTLFDDDDVANAEAILLTFKTIGEKELPRATMAAADLAQFLGIDIANAAKMIGKAMSDPVEGMTALRRAGVMLTDQQEELVKALVETNKGSEAQAYILEQLEGRMGGAAEAAAQLATSGWQNMVTATKDMTEAWGKLLGIISGTDFGRFLRGIANDFSDFADRVGKEKAIDKLVVSISKGVPKAKDIMNTLNAAGADYAFVQERVNQVVSDFKVELESISTDSGPAGQKRIAELKTNIKAYEKLERIVAMIKDEMEAQAKAQAKAEEERKKRAENERKALEERARAEKEAADAAVALENARAEAIQWANEQVALQIEGYHMLTEEEQAAIDLENARADAVAYANAQTADAAKATEARIQQTKDFIEALKDAALDAAMTLAESLGAALVAGEEGWKAFGKAGLNAIAAIIEAMAKEWALAGTAALIPGPTFNPAAAAGYYAAAAAAYVASGALKAIPMAEGGAGITNGPTLFLAGEKGREPFMFGGANNKRGMGMGGNTIHVHGSLLTEKALDARIRAVR